MIKLVYDKEVDNKCWVRYQDFLNRNGNVWGLSREIKQIFTVNNLEMVASVEDILSVYDQVFKIPRPPLSGFVVTTPFSMINDGEIFSTEGIIYYSLFTPNPSIVFAHELFHIYFEKYTKRQILNYEESKEYFTVIMNDLFSKEVSKGYPPHQEVRKKIFDTWLQTKSLDKCIGVLAN